MSEIKKLLIDETWQTKYKRQPKTIYPLSEVDTSSILSIQSILKKFIRGERIPVGTSANYSYNDGDNSLLPSHKKGFDIADAIKLQRELNANKTKRTAKKPQNDGNLQPVVQQKPTPSADGATGDGRVDKN